MSSELIVVELGLLTKLTLNTEIHLPLHLEC